MSTAESPAQPRNLSQNVSQNESKKSTDQLPVHDLEIKVMPKHIDSLGHVNNAVYVKYFERGRIAFYKQLGVPLERTNPPHLGTAVVNLNVNFRDECVVGDRLHLHTQGHSRGNRSFVLLQHLTRPDGSAVADCIVTSVVINLDSRTAEAIPKQLATALPARESPTNNHE
jgi:thioesterase-3